MNEKSETPNERATRFCRVCQRRSRATILRCREMMLGTRDPFEYFECEACGCLQISEFPEDLSPYYPDGYHAFSSVSDLSPVRRFLQRRRAGHVLGRWDLTGWLMVSLFGVPRPLRELLSVADLDRSWSVLDVGAGGGLRLRSLQFYGFRHLTGLDPYLEEDVELGDGVRVFAREIEAHRGSYDLVMLHHVLEHLPRPHQAMRDLVSLLAPTGRLLVRTPVAGSAAQRRYGPDWVQLDPPRHLHVFSLAGLRLLAREAGLEVVTLDFDSTGFQFWGSEQYRRNIPLGDARSHAVDAARSPFDRHQVAAWEAEAEALNAQGLGDQAVVVLARSS